MIMLRAPFFFLLLAVPREALAATSDDASTGTAVTILTGTKAVTTEQQTPTGSYQSYSSQVTLASAALSGSDTSVASNATASSSSSSSAANTLTFLTGSNKPTTTASTTASGNSSISASSTSTSSSPTPTNTTPCNGYPEFCQRKYSNITMVAAHNSPFVKPGNAASNQELDVTAQLDDGVRFLQGQMQWPTNGTDDGPHFCHTTCDLLDAGPIGDWLTKVKNWVAAHPYDVVTVLLENGNYSGPGLYAPYIEATGIVQYAYPAPLAPMRLQDWPTLAELILSGKRVVMFLDYEANQTAYPWLLDEFGSAWETPFDPVDASFPCSVQRPPNLSPEDARDRLMLVNHNLNVDVSLLGADILVPATSLLNQTNAASGNGSLGAAADLCVAEWGRNPNFLNVDYYNYGSPPGSVFEVAARLNNVTYDPASCCGQRPSAAVGLGDGAAGALRRAVAAAIGVAVLVAA